MPGREGAPVQNPAAANQSDDPTSPEQLAAQAEERMETVYELVVSGKTGVRDAFDQAEVKRPQDEGYTPAFYIDGIATSSDFGGKNAPVSAIIADREDTIPRPMTMKGIAHLMIGPADAALDFENGRSIRPDASREDRAEMTHFARLVTRNEAGEPLYEDLAFVRHGEPVSPELNDKFVVRRKNLAKSGDTDYRIEPHVDPAEYARITNEVTDIILTRAQALAEEPLTEARAVVEACEALGALS